MHALHYPNGKDTNHRSATQGLLFLAAWHLLAFLLGAAPENIFLPFFYSQDIYIYIPDRHSKAQPGDISPFRDKCLSACTHQMCWLACSTAPALIEEAPLNSLEFHCRQLLWLSSGQTQVVKYSVVTRAEGCSTLPEEPEINCSWGALRSESTRPCARILAQIKANPTVQLPGHHGLCWGQEKPSARSTRGASAFGLRPEREAV